MKTTQLFDLETDLVQEHFAVVYTPRRQRVRFPENCVTLADSESQAVAQANPEQKRFAAKVAGPSRSSEGYRLYYLVQWL